VVARAWLPTQYGRFRIFAFDGLADGREHVALIRGNPVGERRVATRLHSQCVTGDALASLRSDCLEQLELALADLATREVGVVLYMQQEGRGIGLRNKVRAYALQDFGFDTVEANHRLGFADDERNYEAAAQMLQLLAVESVELMTNNPQKVGQLAEHGIQVERTSHEVVPNPHNAHYLATKRERSGHLLTLVEEL
jgi:GTP cyclohydrolase II